MTRKKQLKRGFSLLLLKYCNVILFILIFACNPPDTTVISTKYFSIQSNNILDMCLKSPSAESKGHILMSNNDTLYYHIGIFVSSLTEKDPNVIYMPNGFDSSNYDLRNSQISNRINFDLDRYRRQNVYFAKIDDYDAKITYPRVHGIGITGIYIDSLFYGDIGSDMVGIVSFHMYANHLSEASELALLKAMNTLNFKNTSSVD